MAGTEDRMELTQRADDSQIIHDYSLCILVVLYRCSIKNCPTLSALLKEMDIYAGTKIKLVIWNNGPERDTDAMEVIGELQRSTSIEIFYEEYLNNKPLAALYNDFIASNDAEKYCIFDQDSLPNRNYLRTIIGERCVDLVVPIARSNGTIHGPLFEAEVVQKSGIIILDGRNSTFFAVSSGLTITRKLIDRVREKYSDVFDENYAFYGVDTSFWIRILRISRRNQVVIKCASEMAHSLSRLETEPEVMRKFRRRERGLDLGITLRRYPEFRWLRAFLAAILRALLGKGHISLIWSIYGYFYGRHPRAKE